jgi:hypothetical protein
LCPVPRFAFMGSCFPYLSFPHTPFDGMSLVVIRSGQGNARGCGGSWWLMLDPPNFGASSGCQGCRNPTSFWVGVNEVCGLLADSYCCCKTFGGKPWLASAFRAWPATGILLFEGPCFARWGLLCLSLRYKAEGPLGKSVGAEGRHLGGYPS